MSALGQKQMFNLPFDVIDWMPGRELKLRMGQSGNGPPTDSNSSTLGWWKLLNIGAIGFTLVQSEKAGEQPFTPQALPPHYRTAPPTLKKVARTKSLQRRKGLSISTLRRGRSELSRSIQYQCRFQPNFRMRRCRRMSSPLKRSSPTRIHAPSVCMAGKSSTAKRIASAALANRR